MCLLQRFLLKRFFNGYTSGVLYQKYIPRRKRRHPAKNPPENYNPIKFVNENFQPPDGIKLKVFRELTRKEGLGPGAGKCNVYKNPEYYAYHRYSYIDLLKHNVDFVEEARKTHQKDMLQRPFPQRERDCFDSQQNYAEVGCQTSATIADNTDVEEGKDSLNDGSPKGESVSPNAKSDLNETGNHSQLFDSNQEK